MSSGWICLHRSLQDHWLFNIDESDKFFAWVDLLMLANHKTETFMLKNKLIECKRGQVAKSQITLQKRWKWSQNKLKRFLNLLEKERMIDFETNEVLTLITICNYEKYQNLESAESSKYSSKLEKSVFFVSKTDDQTDVLDRDISHCNGKEIIDIENDDGRPGGRPGGRPHERTTDDQADDIQQYNNVNNVNKKEYIAETGVSDPLPELEKKIKAPRKPPPPYQDIIDLYHEILKDLPEVYKLNDQRKRHIKSLWIDELDDLNQWRNYFKHIKTSNFLMGKVVNGNKSPFVCTFDFIINPNNFLKIAEDKYHERKKVRVRT